MKKMPELIDKNALRYIESDKDAYTQDWNDDYERGFRDAINKALKLPTIEAEPVRHGHWMFHEQKSGYLWKCSNCKGNFEQQFSYCPHCGSKMYGG